MKHLRILLPLAATMVLTTTAVDARTRTTRRSLNSTAAAVDVLPQASVSDSDSIALLQVNPAAVTLRGYNKRASDSRESFLVTNNLKTRISTIRLLLRYSTLNGEMIHERNVTVPVDLAPGQTRLVSVRTFDTQRVYYYYGSSKPRKQATPFTVAFRLTGYDIPIGY